MAFRILWKNNLKLVVISLMGVLGSVSHPVPSFNPSDYSPKDVITRDICIIGGGSSGTYAALRLGDMGKSVVVVEKADRLGGPTVTYTDPTTKVSFDIGVEVFNNDTIVNNYFARFNISLITSNADPSIGTTDAYVDFRTGRGVIGYTPPNPETAIASYGTQLAKYPYLDAGIHLPDQVPEDLLLPFGDFVTKYSLEAIVYFIWHFAQGLGNLLEQPTLYVMMYINSGTLSSVRNGFVTTAQHDNSLLYVKAHEALGDNVLLNSKVLAMDRDSGTYTKTVVQTPTGKKLIQAKKIIIAIPPKLNNLIGFDLDKNERSIFGQFGNSSYYTMLLNNTGIHDNTTLINVAPNTQYELPPQPALYGIVPTTAPGLKWALYCSTITGEPNEDVKADIVGSLQRMQEVSGFPSTTPNSVVFYAAVPFELTVSAEAIKSGFYAKLYALQGHRNTFYTGAALSAQDSSLVWKFTETLLPNILASLA
ncbi:hypothetical protein MMC13_000025 [Lambiella insularis]|nr:hypothetical protein [Lambiella insularis]